MVIYVTNIILMLFWHEVLNVQRSMIGVKNPKKTFCVIAALQWILISGLRGLSVGADTISYKDDFDMVSGRTWSSLIKSFNAIVFEGAQGKDPGYKLLEKAFQIFSDNYQMWLIFIAVIFMVPMAIWIYKRSEDALMSFLIYSCLFASFFSITGHRQTIATAFVVFVGDFLIKKRKFVPFLLIVLVMSTIHKSCLVFLPFYFLYNKKITTPYIIFVIIAAVLTFIFQDSFMEFLAETSGYEDYSRHEGAGAYTFSIMILLIMIAALWRMRIILEEHPEASASYNALMLALVFLPLTFVNPNTMRVVQYFSIYLMIVVPYILHSFKGRQRAYITLAVIAILLFLHFKTPRYYEFFWQ